MAGIKHDQSKPRMDLIPGEALDELGKVLAYGAEKYTPGNWAEGINYSRLIAAAYRHITAFNRGEDLDPESGLSHVSHAMCNLAFLCWHVRNLPGFDDRWVKQVKNE